ncbi:hypothetical protein M3N64_08460 [Sporolactobacillus sp. CPB3-1]|uniref:Uncharacterized protein n=1 Tax=Sporolactobacillus mangiferae TaxID=2940498 RepID=A0ABT0MAT8_9BACL|nr:hypothetical protein [Sporolactobacillus mangiferae]MCL1631979.1 hypothetical protein [Sporolactobacillus mangiferae]
MAFDRCKIEVFIPEDYIAPLRNRLNTLSILTVGNYDHVIPYSKVKGYWRPQKLSVQF